MGLRFRKSISLAPGLRLNISKRGGSLSIGGKGVTVNVGRKGVRSTLGLPGSGVSYSGYRKYENDNTPPGARQVPWAAIVLLAVAGLALAWLV